MSKKIIILSLILSQFICLNVFAQPQERITVGAIRWDAWIGDLQKGFAVGLQVERSLNPREYHYRTPFFSKEISKDSIQIRELSQDIMDQDIQYANSAGIDYWAFCWYQSRSGLDSVRNLYLSSNNKNNLKFCMILGTDKFDIHTDGIWLLEQFKKVYYQKVRDDRPLLYLYGPSFGTSDIKTLRKMCQISGIPNPYMVLMHTGSDATLKIVSDSLGVDAVSKYNSSKFNNGGPYSPLIPNEDVNGWEYFKNAGAKVIPWVTTGRNMKPRIDHAVSWQSMTSNSWVADGTPDEIGDHLKNALNWTSNHRDICEARTVIIYAWNEFDEGGWICPTLGNNTSRLDAIRKTIENFRHHWDRIDRF